MQKANPKKQLRKPQKQNRPGNQYMMKPQPVNDDKRKMASGKLSGKTALITGGDSGIGRAVAILFAKEGADIAIVYLKEHVDAKETKSSVEEYGRKCIAIAGDISKEVFCQKAVRQTVRVFGKIDVLVNNAATQFPQEEVKNISAEQLVKTFATNIFSMFWFVQAALPHMNAESTIINTASVTAYRGSAELLDYASTKGAIVAFTRSLSAKLVDQGIRVNGVAPGPIWTPLIASTFDPEKVSSFGSDVPMKRAGEPVEVAPCYLFLACDDSSYMTGQFLHPNGGEIVNG